MTYVLDTHPVVWFLETSQRLSVRARNVLRDPSHTFILPTLVLVEITYLYTRGRIEVDAVTVQQRLVSASNCVLYPLDEQVAMLIPTELNIHDAIIVATALVYRDSERGRCSDHEKRRNYPFRAHRYGMVER
jgi:PIN domain nuclease of toxin-antitoxin system